MGRKEGLAPKRSKKKVYELKENIAKLMSQGLSNKDIMSALKLPNNTFYRYYDEAVKELQKEHLSKTNRIVFGFATRSMNRVKELQRKFRETGDIRSLKIAQDIEDSVNKLFQDLGILERTPDRIQQENVIIYERPDWLDQPRDKKNKTA